MKQLIYCVMIFALCSGCVRKSLSFRCIHLSGERLLMTDDEDIRWFYSFCERGLIVSKYDKKFELLSLPDSCGNMKSMSSFVNVGRGPYDVGILIPDVCVQKDSIYILDRGNGAMSLSKILTASINDLDVPTRWSRISLEWLGQYVGDNLIKMEDGTFLVWGGGIDEETLLSIVDIRDSTSISLDYWFDDNISCIPMVKRNWYGENADVSISGNKVLVSLSRGRYMEILTIADKKIVGRNIIYNQLPSGYKVADDGVNYISPPSYLGGIRARSTDQHIYCCIKNDDIKNGRRVIQNYNGYPPYFLDKVEVYDWDGNFQCIYEMDVPFRSFIVSPDDNFIYTNTIDLVTGKQLIIRYDLGQ